MTDAPKSAITPDLVAEHGLKPDEYQRLLKILGREPSLTELGIFSVMWSEHCSYKSSRVWLKTLPTSGPKVIQGPGENAGIVDLGDGDCAVSFRDVSVEVLEGAEAFSETTGTIVVNSVAARLESADAGQAVLDKIALRDAVTCDGDPNAIVYIENRGGADVAFSWSIDVAGEQGPLETGVVLVRRGDVIMVGSVVAEAGVHDIESVLWRVVDHAIVGLDS